jgi:hypothetical protein
MISACRDWSMCPIIWFLDSLRMTPSRLITLPNGSSPPAIPSRASFTQRAIIARSIASEPIGDRNSSDGKEFQIVGNYNDVGYIAQGFSGSELTSPLGDPAAEVGDPNLNGRGAKIGRRTPNATFGDSQQVTPRRAAPHRLLFMIFS